MTRKKLRWCAFVMTIVYDLPYGVELAQPELPASAYSGGVKVDLR